MSVLLGLQARVTLDDPPVDGPFPSATATTWKGATGPVGAEVARTNAVDLGYGGNVLSGGLAAVAGHAQNLQVCDGIGAAQGEWNDVVDLPPCARRQVPAAALAAALCGDEDGETLSGRKCAALDWVSHRDLP
jgi:hypothetical protein